MGVEIVSSIRVFPLVCDSRPDQREPRLPPALVRIDRPELATFWRAQWGIGKTVVADFNGVSFGLLQFVKTVFK